MPTGNLLGVFHVHSRNTSTGILTVILHKNISYIPPLDSLRRRLKLLSRDLNVQYLLNKHKISVTLTGFAY